MKKIYLIENEKIFEKWASKTYEYKINQLKKDNIIKVIDISQVTEENKQDILTSDYLIFGWNVTSISKYYTYKYDFYQKYIPNLEKAVEIKEKISMLDNHPRKVQVVQDLHEEDYDGGIKSLISYLKDGNFHGIITPYFCTDVVKDIRTKLDSLKIYHLPHHIDNNYFHDYELEKEYDIFFFGNSKPRFYPFRHRLKELLQKNEDLKSLKILVWEGIRNYFKFDSRKSNDQLSKVMNQSWLTICTKSKCNMLLGKYFETSMSGSVVCGDISEDGEQTWKDNMIYIDDSMSDEEIIKEIKDALLDKEKLIVKTEKMKKRMEKYYLGNFTTNLMGMFE